MMAKILKLQEHMVQRPCFKGLESFGFVGLSVQAFGFRIPVVECLTFWARAVALYQPRDKSCVAVGKPNAGRGSKLEKIGTALSRTCLFVTRKPVTGPVISPCVHEPACVNSLLGRGCQWGVGESGPTAEPKYLLFRWTLHPVIVTIGNNRDYIRVLLHSYYYRVGGPPNLL